MIPKRYILTLIFIFTFLISYSQAFTKTYAAAQNSVATAICTSSDGNLILVGESAYSFGGYTGADLLVMKLTKMGDTLWTQHITRDTSMLTDYFEEGTAVLENREGDIVVAATGWNGGPDDLGGVLVKLDQSGSVLQTKMNTSIRPYDLIETSSGRLMAVGTGFYSFAGPRAQVAMFDKNLNMLWTIQYSSFSEEEGGLRGLCEMSPNEFVLGGFVNSSGISNAMVSSCDSLGNINWSRELQSGISYHGFVQKLTKYDDSTFIAVGRTIVPSQYSNAAAWKLKLDGWEDWMLNGVGAYQNGQTQFNDVVVTSEMNIVMVGVYDTTSSWTGSEGLFYELDASGNVLKSNLMKEPVPMAFNGVVEDENTFFIVGEHGASGNYDAAFLRNKFILNDSLCGITVHNEGGVTSLNFAYGGYIPTTNSSVGDQAYDFDQAFGVNLETHCEHDSDLATSKYQSSINYYPNPSSGLITIEDYYGSYQIYDLSGKLLRLGEVVDGGTISLEGLEPAFYIVKLNSHLIKVLKI